MTPGTSEAVRHQPSEICRYSLARFNYRNSSLQMHRLVQAALLYQMTEEDRATMRRGAHLLLAANDPNDPNDVNRWDRYGSLHPHVVVSEAVRSQGNWVRNLVVNEVIYLLRWGDYTSGLELARTALRAAHNLGVSLPLTGDFARARDIDEMTWNSYITMYGQDHVDTVRTWLGFILDIRELGEYGDARLYHQELVERSTSLLGTHHPSTLLAFHHLAAAQRLAGRHEQALRTAEQAQDALIRRYGPENPETQAAALDVALELDTDACQRARRMYGDDHPHVLAHAVNVAVDLRSVGRSEESDQLRDRTVERFKRRLGSRHPAIRSAADLDRMVIDHTPMPL
ncbi:tetratricopeptide repeat protein [Streptomyces nigra]|uniref:tetratricopeptide repeat protein n=1 Tax=Streptomyces nigra TaxID=1827580 RepID=UPI0036C57A62